MKKFMQLIFAVFTALFFTGCPSQQAWLAKQPPMYAKGFEDGCKSAERWWQNNLADYKVVDPEAENNPRYKEGWRYGYDKCYGEKETEIWMTRGRF